MASVKIKNKERLLKRLNNIANMDLSQAMNKATALVHGQAKALAPSDTGGLRASIHMETKKKGNELVGRVYTAKEYASYVEFGTGSKGNGTYPYKVDGLNLEYRDTPWTYTPDGGETFYRTKGQVAQPYMYPALERNKKKIQRMFNEEIKSEISKQSGGN